MDNTPTLMQSEEERAPWNDNPFEKEEQYKTIEVTISQTLSSTQKIQVPIDFDETDNTELESLVNETVMLPSDYAVIKRDFKWEEDDFAVILEK